jgi:hypothetical protein
LCGQFQELLLCLLSAKATQSLGDHAKLNAWLDKAVKRFAERRAGEHGQQGWSALDVSAHRSNSRRLDPHLAQV